MSRSVIALGILVSIAGLLVVGCEGGGMKESAMMQCAGCGKQMAEGDYCKHCQMLAVRSTQKMVHCDKCNMDMPAGKYCKMCNRFMLAGDAKCPGCGMTAKAGMLCSPCKMYAGCPKVKYCEGCKGPCPKDGCEDCKKG